MNTLGKSAENRKLPASYNHSASQKDRKLGARKEKRFELWLKNSQFFPDKSFDKTTGWNEMDYVSDCKTIYIELKGRRCNKYDYDTTMIGHNKYIKARKLIMKGFKVYFFFSFRDRVCFYPVPIMLPSAVDIRDGGTWRRGCDEVKKHLYIPVGLLYDVKDFPSIRYFNEFLLNRDYEETEFKKLLTEKKTLVNVKC
tara:strand:+ start:1020 stop:1610 length:591 start_codon:yes stop_codon:yes gene_type:complete